MKTLRFIPLLAVLLPVVFSAPALASDHDAQGTPLVVTTAKTSSVNQWLEAAGINPECDGLARDVFALMVGIHQPINNDVSLRVSAGREFSVGVTF